MAEREEESNTPSYVANDDGLNLINPSPTTTLSMVMEVNL